MATSSVKHFYLDIELVSITSMPNAVYAAKFPGVKGIRNDSFSMKVGYPATGTSGPFPVQRQISYKRFASRHECNSKCMGGRHNGTCECKCGGKNHGLGSFMGPSVVATQQTADAAPLDGTKDEPFTLSLMEA
jgi:hypothetical protein